MPVTPRRLPLLAALLLAACGSGGGPAPAPVCGDGVAQAGEACDGADLRGQSCAAQGFDGGALACGPACALDTSGCTRPPTCGDGVASGGEACDGADLRGQSCASLGQGFAGGALACGPACALDTSGCTRPPTCGDGVASGGEACDGADLRGQSCASLGQGFTGGALACGPACAFLTTGCTPAVSGCGDGVLQDDEACDDGNAFDLDGCSAACQLEQPDSGWFAPGGWISEGPP